MVAQAFLKKKFWLIRHTDFTVNCSLFERSNKRHFSIREAKEMLNKNSNMYSDEEVKKIVDFPQAVAELSVVAFGISKEECGESKLFYINSFLPRK